MREDVTQFTELDEEEQDEVVRLVYDRFAGRLEFFAIRKEGAEGERAKYVPSDHEFVKREVREIGSSEFTEDAVRAHLEGKHLIGVYPIAADSTVSFFAFDFDGKNGDPLEASLAQAKILYREAGLDVYIERSQSGAGYHVWGFLDGPMNAGQVRHALSPFIDDVDVFDRLFPCQDGVNSAQPKGNLIALPLHGGRLHKGRTAFVNREGKPQKNQFQFLRNIKLIPVAKMEELAQKAGDYVPGREITQFQGEAESLGRSWKLTHPLIGCDFWRQGIEEPESISEPLWYAMACNLAQLEDGRELFHRWSAADEMRYSPRHTDKKYDQALRASKPHSCEVIRSLGGNCTCDLRFPGKVYHPFDLVRLPITALLDSVELDEEEVSSSVGQGFQEVRDWLVEVQKDPTLGRGLPTSIPELTKHFGYREGEITVVAARNGRGKTALAIQEAVRLTLEGHASVKLYSLEMTRRQVFQRALSTVSGVTQNRMAMGMLTSSDWSTINDAIRQVENVDLSVDDTSAHLDAILESAAEFVLSRQAAGKKAVIILDYLQIVPRLPRENEQDALSRTVTALKRLAKILGCHVIALCQLNRGADDATTESQTYDSWLRGSDVIAYVADNILIVLGDKGPGVVERLLALHKQRNGEAGITLVLEFNQPLMRWAYEGEWGVTMPDPSHREDADEYPDVPEELQPADFTEFNNVYAELVEGM